MQQFYETHYGKAVSSGRIAAVAAALLPYLAERGRWLDIGCGSMDASVALEREVLRLGCKTKVDISGRDVSSAAIEAAKARGYHARVADISTCQVGEDERGSMDVVLFLEVIEHVVDTDRALSNIHEILAPNGLLVISTPNLAAWYNRLLLLFGFQPHGTEVSFAPYRFGCRFLEKVFRESGGIDPTAGHLRAFTLRALKELLVYHGFRVERCSGVANHRWDIVGRIVSKIWPGGAGNIVIIARRAISR